MFILSHVLGNKLFYVSVVLVNQIRVILPQTSFELHVHVVCSPFLLRAYFQNMKLNTLITFFAQAILMLKYGSPLPWPRGYTTFFMLNSTEHEISTADKN